MEVIIVAVRPCCYLPFVLAAWVLVDIGRESPIFWLTIYRTDPLTFSSPPLFSSSEVTSSQPVTSHLNDTTADMEDGGVAIESFTQPSRFDELIIGTQIPCTPGASQVTVIHCALVWVYVASFPGSLLKKKAARREPGNSCGKSCWLPAVGWVYVASLITRQRWLEASTCN